MSDKINLGDATPYKAYRTNDVREQVIPIDIAYNTRASYIFLVDVTAGHEIFQLSAWGDGVQLTLSEYQLDPETLRSTLFKSIFSNKIDHTGLSQETFLEALGDLKEAKAI